ASRRRPAAAAVRPGRGGVPRFLESAARDRAGPCVSFLTPWYNLNQTWNCSGSRAVLLPNFTMIKHVRITNFKSLADVALDLEPVTVLIGRRGAGKSNFVEALRRLRDALASRNLGALHGSNVLCATASRPLTLSFDLRFTAPRVAEDFRYILRL